MGILYSLPISLAAGWLASRIMKGGAGYGLAGDLILGVAGSVVGGWIFGLLGLFSGGGLIGSLTVSTVGSMALLSVLRRAPEHDADDLTPLREFAATGIARRTAACMVEFIPMAFCRVFLEHTGAGFADTFRRGSPHAPSRDLLTEPVWRAALEYAREEVRRGVTEEDVLALAGRSAEFNAASQLMTEGNQLSSIRFTEPLLVWPEEGPAMDQTAATKPWWRFW